MHEYVLAREKMVDCQVRPSDVTRHEVIAAMLAVPREAFVPKSQRKLAYSDAPLRLSPHRHMMEPRTLAKMLDALELREDDHMLILGCGMGYSVAVAGKIVRSVVAVEMDEALARQAEALISEHQIDNASVLLADVMRGAAEHGPYDAVLLEFGVEELPGGLLDQLRDGGRLIAVRSNGMTGKAMLWRQSAGGLPSSYPLFDALAPASGAPQPEEEAFVF